MDSMPSRAPVGRAIVGIASSSVALFFFGTGLHPHWWLAWLMLIPVLLLSGRLSARSAFVVALAS